MPRTIGLVAILICAAAAFGAAVAQPATLPECDLAAKRMEIATGKLPDFVGCRVGDAVPLIESLHLEVITPPDEAVTGVAPGIVTGQSRDGGTVALTMSMGVGYPPTPAPAPAPAPPVTTPAGPAPPPPAPQRVSFSIADAAPVPEGHPLTFRVSRLGDDGRAHSVRVRFNPPELVGQPEMALEFPAGEPAGRTLAVATAPGTPGDGSHVVEAMLVPTEGTAIGIPRSARGTITDAGAPPPPAPPQPETRQCPDGSVIPVASACAEPTKTCRDDSVIPVSQPCPSGLLDELNRWLEWLGPNLALVLGGIAFVGAVLAHHLLPKPAVDVTPSLELEPGAAAFQPLGEPVLRWPKIGADLTIETGAARVTQPLPRVEPADG